MDVDKLIQHIPNNVSGDGKPFVAALKKALIKYKEDLNKKIDDSTADAGEKPGHVSSVQLLELHSITDGVRINSIQVSWVKTTVTNYAKAEVWLRTATDKAWEKAGESSGTQFVYSGATTGLTYYIKVVAVNTKGNTADFDTAPQASIKIQGSQYIPNPPTQFVLTWDEKGPLWKWLFEPNEYIDFFELRLDQNPGVWNDKRLDSTRETWSRANPGVRSGTAYLYIRNIFGEYSEPAVHEFNKALPQKPTAPQLTSTIDGVRIKMQGLPLGATGYKIHIKTKDSQETVEDDFYTVNSEYIYFFFIGHITVKYCFVDPLGDGEWSDTSEADCKAGIDIGQVPTIDYTKFDKFTQDAIDKANNQPSINDALKKLITDNTTAINEANKLIDANANGIHQNTDSISSVMTKVNGLNEKVEGVEGTVTTQGTAIVQTAADITALAKRVTINEGAISTNTSSIQQNADSITSVVRRVDTAEGTLKTHGTAIQQNANSISTIAMDVQGNTSAIEQNANSITSVVTELNKKPADCNYSSINQLQDDILLRVKKDGVINAINVSTEGIVIDGNKVHITGDTVFDNNVIVGGMIAADSIALEHLKANSVSSAKIQANAITSTKIAAGAVTADKIEAGAITAEKLAADSVTSDAIQAGSVIGDKIAANTITGKHFAAANIDLTGALTITGGNVKLSQEGMRCSYDNGRYTLFNNQGMFFYDSNGTAFAGIGRFVVGVAKHDDYIKFRTAWDVTPTVIVIPLKMQISAEGYTASNLFWTTGAIDVTNAGFRIQAYSTLGAGSSGLLVLNKVFLTETNFSGVASGFEIITPLQNATHGNFVVRVNLAGERWQQDLGGSTWPAPPNIIYHYRLLTYKVELYINDKLTKTEIPPNGTAYDKASIDVAFDVDFESGSTIKIVTSAWVAESHKPEGNYAVSSSVVSAQYNVQADTIISTGEVAFIATEASNATYDITTDK